MPNDSNFLKLFLLTRATKKWTLAWEPVARSDSKKGARSSYSKSCTALRIRFSFIKIVLRTAKLTSAQLRDYFKIVAQSRAVLGVEGRFDLVEFTLGVEPRYRPAGAKTRATKGFVAVISIRDEPFVSSSFHD